MYFFRVLSIDCFCYLVCELICSYVPSSSGTAGCVQASAAAGGVLVEEHTVPPPLRASLELPRGNAAAWAGRGAAGRPTQERAGGPRAGEWQGRAARGRPAGAIGSPEFRTRLSARDVRCGQIGQRRTRGRRGENVPDGERRDRRTRLPGVGAPTAVPRQPGGRGVQPGSAPRQLRDLVQPLSLSGPQFPHL